MSQFQFHEEKFKQPLLYNAEDDYPLASRSNARYPANELDNLPKRQDVMTLLCAWSGQRFIIIGSDTQVGVGDDTGGTRSTQKKLHCIPDFPIIWGLTGNGGLYEQVGRWLDRVIPELHKNDDMTTVNIAENLGEYVSQLNARMMDRAERINRRRQASDGITLLLAGTIKGELISIHIDTYGHHTFFPSRMSGIHSFIADGSAMNFANGIYGLLSHYEPATLDLEASKKAVYRILDDTVMIAERSVGLPLDLWIVTKDQCKQLSTSELAATATSVTAWKQAEKGSINARV